MKKDLDMAQSTDPPSIKWVVSDKENAEYLQDLFEDKNIDIIIEYQKKI